MSTRRKFLLNGSIAATAFLAAKPFNAVAGNLPSLTGYKNTNNLTLAHTGNGVESDSEETIRHLANLKNSSQNLVLLHAGETGPAIAAGYDASLHAGGDSSIPAGDYKIVYKGKIKTGIITAPANTVSASTVNDLAVYLKNTRDCHLVVCLSQLGYRSTNGLNDLELAAASTHIDVIIGGKSTNACSRPVITQNKNKQEVIINYAAEEGLAKRKIEIAFNSLGKKEQVLFSKIC